MRRSRTKTATTTAAGVLAALALAAAPTAAADQPRVPDGEEQLRQEVTSAAQEAQQQVRLEGTAPGQETAATTALEAGMASMVDDGAVGVTARVEGPNLSWRGSDGLRDVDSSVPATWRDQFRAASNTKPMVATLVLQEVEAGSWALDTPVDNVIPGLFPDHPDVTIRQLLSHTSGAPLGTDLVIAPHITDPESYEELLAALSRDYDDQDHIDAINGVPWGPAGQFSYSNSGYVALGMLLEAQTGQTVEELLDERVLAPVRMKHTSYPDDPGLRGPVLHEDAWIGDGWLDLAGFDPDVFSHAGAAVTTTQDLNTFTDALLTGELVDQALVEEMMSPASSGPLEYGLGIYRLPDPCSPPDDPQWLYGHDGASFGTLSVAYSSPDGTRQVSLAATGRDVSSLTPRWDLGDVLVPALLATC